ncbi:hypothetical protein CH54_446 [Yersinia rochesterensis]|uniref:Inner membrane protein n=2 Tax=Yersinia rochesterensis TaxID=1604335 RepID=A0ABM5SSB4_9GAMM|nr:hypothetical protein DJ57_1297 [Yersinia rochesterensis]AJI88839.1 hypothetical protein AW19_1216 [Yersinia frederiksenii Y225]AJJ37408.1 hypothetical protein CH54_446 [Yersinia rochesterensis]CNH37553.1 Uncharacterised protein [Yersinia kristensenii]CRY63770.1 Uncharacterised protein [Yersinia kristensenii]
MSDMSQLLILFLYTLAFEAAGLLAALITRPVHGPRLCEAAASSVQIGSRLICHPNHLLVVDPKVNRFIGICLLAAYLQLQILWVCRGHHQIKRLTWLIYQQL